MGRAALARSIVLRASAAPIRLTAGASGSPRIFLWA